MTYSSAVTATRSATSTCTASRVDAVLTLFLGDVAALISRGLVARDRAAGWLRDLTDVLLLEAIERFRLKVTMPDGRELGLDYEVSDDGQITSGDSSGGFASHWIPANAAVTIVVRWKTNAPKRNEAWRLLQSRGWGPGTMIEASGVPDRAYADGGYGVYRRLVGEWQT